MRIAFIDHAFHRKTRSSEFFLAELKKLAEVDEFYFDPEDAKKSWASLKRTFNPSGYDLALIWQLEILAHLPLALGVPTVVAPMYDGCAQQPWAHWKLLSDSALLNFSYNLHLATRDLVPRQKLVKYFPNPEDFPVADFSKGLRVLLWHRRADQVTAEAAFRLTRGQFESLHVHVAPDDPDERVEFPPWLDSYAVTTSRWFERRAEFDALMDRHCVAVMPRFTEGIGMFLQECMARGMCVLASSWPVHNEYVCNNVNGMLFDPGSYGAVNMDDARRLGRAARRTAERGHAAWRRQVDELPAFLSEVVEAEPARRLDPVTAERLVLAYFGDMSEYHLLAREIAQRDGHAPPASHLPAARPAEDAPTEFDHVRRAMRLVPGWRAVKSMVPTSVKLAVARRLVPQA